MTGLCVRKIQTNTNVNVRESHPCRDRSSPRVAIDPSRASPRVAIDRSRTIWNYSFHVHLPEWTLHYLETRCPKDLSVMARYVYTFIVHVAVYLKCFYTGNDPICIEVSSAVSDSVIEITDSSENMSEVCYIYSYTYTVLSRYCSHSLKVKKVCHCHWKLNFQMMKGV